VGGASALAGDRSAFVLVGFSARDGWFFGFKKTAPRARAFLFDLFHMQLEKEKTR